jgi:hypothetical protein
MLIITMRGTDNNIPTTPQILPQNQSAIRITSGLKLSLFPINFGSIIFPINTCTQINPVAKNANG